MQALPVSPDPVDAARAAAYALCARLFRAPLEAALLARIADDVGILDPGEPGPLADAWQRLRAACSAVDVPAAQDEFDALFGGIGSPRVSPYGAMHRPPAAADRARVDLRQDLARLGLARRRDVHEPEDHLSVLCEVMRWLLAGGPAATSPLPPGADRVFFDRHLRPWYGRFADAVEREPDANFYRVAARFLRAFLDLETEGYGFDSAAPAVIAAGRACGALPRSSAHP